MEEVRPVDVTPSARRLTTSLRDIGYDFETALADIVDNSVSADATRIDVTITFDGPASRVTVADDGTGMTRAQLQEALRFGSRRPYEQGDLGRFGLGLKTASLSQCRRVTVVTNHALRRPRIVAHRLDLDHIEATDRWEIIGADPGPAVEAATEWLRSTTGTVVIWELLDRVLPDARPHDGWARRRIEALGRRASTYLGMVFHRFIEGTAGEWPLTITINGEKVRAWNPLAPDEPHRLALPRQVFELTVGRRTGRVLVEPVVLPPRDAFSSIEEFERLAGPGKWNRQQGFYFYRSDRMVQGGGWSGLRAVDEHVKLARAAVSFETDVDPLFRVNVAKRRVSLPPELRTMLERPVQELCRRADHRYRSAAPQRRPAGSGGGAPASPLEDIGLALKAAAMEVGEYAALLRVAERLRDRAPDAARQLGL